ncbi:MAG: HEAT repeat domain-containing protein [Nitrospirae bacterium]|nr:HEAT repeat domain-containing protein [Nitrospirota bacterium]
MNKAKLDRLIKALRHPDASKRRSAAETLSEGDERAVYPLISIALRDDNLGVQDAAMRALMTLGGEITAYMVLPLLRENPFLRNTALIILKNIGETAVPLLQPLLIDKDEDVRKFALDLICDIGHCDYLDKIAELLAHDPNANVRASAAKVIGVLQYKEGMPRLIDALKDEEWVCFSTLEALAELKEESSIGPIVGLLNTTSETIRFAAIEALGKIGHSGASPALVEHISKINGYEKIAAIKSLVQIGITPSITDISDALLDMLKAEEWEGKFVAIKGLSGLKDKSGLIPILDLAGSLDPSDPESEDRLMMIKGAVREFGCADSLIHILDNPSAKYRGKVIAIEVIGDLKCKEAVPNLIQHLQSELRDVRRASIKSLGEIDGEYAKPFILEAVGDHDSHVRKTAVEALGKIGDNSAFEPIIKLLRNEKYMDIIEKAVQALMSINSSLFLAQVKEFSDEVQKIAERFMLNPERESQETW